MKSFALFVLFAVATTANANELNAFLFQLSKEIKTDVEIVEVEESKYLISVGRANFNNTNPKSKLNAIRLSRQRAEESALKFIHGSKVIANEWLINKKDDQKTQEENNLTYSEFLRATTDVYQDLGGWEVNDEYLTSISYKVPDPR